MLLRGDRLIDELYSILERECELHQRYLKVLLEEKLALEKLDHQTVSELAFKRQSISTELEQLQIRRLEIIGQSNANRAKKLANPSLTKWVELNCHPEDQQRLIKSITRLKKLALELQIRAREFASIMDFSMRLVKGSLSLIWSGQDQESSVYSGSGKVKTTYIPSSSSPVNGLVRKV